MSDRYFTVGRTELGKAFDPLTLQSFQVVATKHVNALPGFADENCFAVERVENGRVIAAWGFRSAQDCFRFLTENGEVGFEVPDMRGELYTDVRVCMGIPDAAVRVYNSAQKTVTADTV